MSRKTLVLSFVALFAVLAADVASACTSQCVKVAPPFCRRCLDVGTYTGATCQDSGNCGCFYTHNTCSPGVAASGGAKGKADLAVLGFQAEDATACSVSNAAPVEVDFEVASN